MVIDLNNKKQYYKTFSKKKPSGGVRWISYAIEPLLSRQKELQGKLDKLYIPPNCVYGFIKRKGVKKAITPHIGKDFVCTFDIKNFFDSIKKKDLLLTGLLTEEEVEIATLNNRLVQGTCVAPVLSNIYLRFFDVTIYLICDANNWDYSRYADDIIISANGENPYYKIQSILDKSLPRGLKINKEKSKCIYKNESQIVLGVTVNTKASVNYSIRKNLRAKIHQDNINASDIGYINYCNSINNEQASKLIGGIYK